MLLENLLKILFAGIASGIISLTVTESKIFATFRGKVKRKSKFFGELFSCPYCFSHWVSAVLTIIYKPILISSSLSVPWLSYGIDLSVSCLVMIFIASISAGLSMKSLS